MKSHFSLLPSFSHLPQPVRAFLVAVKDLPAMQESWVRSLGWDDVLEKGLATHSSTLAWRIPWTEEPGGLQSMGLTLHFHFHLVIPTYLPDPSCLSTASGLASYLPLLLILFHAAPLSELLSDHSKLKGFFFFSTFLLKSFNFLLFLWEDTQIYYHSLSQVANVIFVSLSENK